MIKNFIKIFLKTSFLYPLLISPFLILLYKIYLRKISAFGCFDDCFNITAGYFITQEKILYKDFFFNHQPLMAFLSFGIQSITDPINIFALILAHRKFILIFSILINLLIVARFRFAGIGFVLFYETTKFYVFGDRFLAEAIIVYPLVYILGLVWQKFNNKKIFKAEYVLTAFFTWFVIFLREPFIPLAVFLFVLILFGRKLIKTKVISIFVFIFLTIFLLLKLPLSDYIFNVISLNKDRALGQESIFGFNFFKIFFYPLYIFISGEWGNFRIILISQSLLFILFTIFLIKTGKIKFAGLIIFILGLANIRYVKPGHAFYESFHMAPWYGMFIFANCLFLQSLWNEKLKRRIKYFLVFLLAGIFVYILSPRSFIWEKVDQHTEFITNYGNYLSYGEAAKILALPKDTFFVDGFDELIYWQAGLPSSYKYLWYTSFMPYISLYSDERSEMFKSNPPDIYYGNCPKEKADVRLIPEEYKSLYVNLYAYGGPTCFYIKKANLNKISKEQWKKAAEFGFYLKL